MKKLAFFLLFYSSFSAFSQNGTYEPFDFPSKIPAGYKVDAKHLYDSIRNVPRIGGDTIEQGQVRKFAKEQGFSLKSLFQGGFVYIGWEEMQEYLNEVFQRAIPKSESMRGQAKIYPSTGTSWNARAFYDGSILVDVGFFADLHSEAELAFVLGHEAVHFFEKDVEKQFFRQVDDRERRKRKREYRLEQVTDALEEASYSRKDESEADSVGAHYVHEGGYDLSHGIHGFSKLRGYKELYEKADSLQASEEEEENDEEGTIEGVSEAKEAIEGLFSSHPQLKERIKELKRIDYELDNEGDAFQVGEERFYELRKEARYETLRLLLQRGDYEECVMRSFKYHLVDPDDPNFREYLVRSLRRSLFVAPGKRDKGFLHWAYKESKDDSISILEDLRQLVKDSVRSEKIEATGFQRDSNHLFRSYQGAYDHFSQAALEEEEAYAFLCKGIEEYLASNYEKRDSFLNKYLKAPEAKHVGFAKALLEDELSDRKPEGRPLMIVKRFRFVEDRPYGYYREYFEEDERAEEYLDRLHSMIGEEFSEDLDLVYQPEYFERKLNKGIEFQRIYGLIFQYPEKILGRKIGDRERDEDPLAKVVKEHMDESKEKRDTGFFHLAPEYWDYFHENGISSLEYLFTFGFEDRVNRKKSYFDLINPWFYLSSPWRFNAAFKTGAETYYHHVGHVRFAPWNKQELSYHLEATPYRLTKNNFINAAYYAIGDSRWDDE